MADYLLQIVSIFSLVASVIVGLYALAYSLMLWEESRRGKARKDWKISMLFYAGVLLVVVGNLLNAVSDLYEFGARYASPFAYFAGLLFFFMGFRKRTLQELK